MICVDQEGQVFISKKWFSWARSVDQIARLHISSVPIEQTHAEFYIYPTRWRPGGAQFFIEKEMWLNHISFSLTIFWAFGPPYIGLYQLRKTYNWGTSSRIWETQWLEKTNWLLIIEPFVIPLWETHWLVKQTLTVLHIRQVWFVFKFGTERISIVARFGA